MPDLRFVTEEQAFFNLLGLIKVKNRLIRKKTNGGYVKTSSERCLPQSVIEYLEWSESHSHSTKTLFGRNLSRKHSIFQNSQSYSAG